MTKWEMRFKLETGRCPDNDVQYFADWLQRELSKLTSTLSEAKMERDKQADLKLLADAFFENLQIDNCEFGGLGLDCKRPFGNSDVESDILEIIGWKPEGDDGHGACYASFQKEYAYSLYHEHLISFLQEQWKLVPHPTINAS